MQANEARKITNDIFNTRLQKAFNKIDVSIRVAAINGESFVKYNAEEDSTDVRSTIMNKYKELGYVVTFDEYSDAREHWANILIKW